MTLLVVQIWIKSAVFERQHGTAEDALRTTEEAIAKFPEADKLYMIKGQILDSLGNVSGAREAYAAGTRKVPTSIPLWLLAARLEEKAGLAIKARALLERARHYNPKNDELWLESIRVEERHGNVAQAKAMMARGASRDHPVVCVWCAPPFSDAELRQHCKRSGHRVCSGPSRSGWKTDRSARPGPSTR
jgi:pre-mRNA-processing factor 6